MHESGGSTQPVVGICGSSMTQTAPPQFEQAVTSRHSVGGRQGPKQPSRTLRTSPFGHGMGCELHITEERSQLRSMTQRPKLQVTSSGPICRAWQRLWMQTRSQYGSVAPSGAPMQLQQSCKSTQSSAV